MDPQVIEFAALQTLHLLHINLCHSYSIHISSPAGASYASSIAWILLVIPLYVLLTIAVPVFLLSPIHPINLLSWHLHWRLPHPSLHHPTTKFLRPKGFPYYWHTQHISSRSQYHDAVLLPQFLRALEQSSYLQTL